MSHPHRDIIQQLQRTAWRASSKWRIVGEGTPITALVTVAFGDAGQSFYESKAYILVRDLLKKFKASPHPSDKEILLFLLSTHPGRISDVREALKSYLFENC
jgi:hypothetical protein